MCDEEHIAKALEYLGYEVIRIQREATNLTYAFAETLVEIGIVDFVLIAQWDSYPQGMIATVKGSTNTPVIYWAFDYQNDGQEWHERLVKGCDLYLSKPFSDSKYENWQWLSQDFSPEFLTADWDNRPEKDIDVLFTGSYLPWATERLEALRAVDDHFSLHIYSFTPEAFREAGFKNVNGPVMDEELMQLIPRAKVCLSIDHTLARGYWSDRSSQMMACGAVVLTRYVPMMEARFHDAVRYFHNNVDLIGEIESLLAQDNMTVLEMYAWNFARQNLTVTTRVQDMLRIAGSL